MLNGKFNQVLPDFQGQRDSAGERIHFAARVRVPRRGAVQPPVSPAAWLLGAVGCARNCVESPRLVASCLFQSLARTGGGTFWLQRLK